MLNPKPYIYILYVVSIIFSIIPRQPKTTPINSAAACSELAARACPAAELHSTTAQHLSKVHLVISVPTANTILKRTRSRVQGFCTNLSWLAVFFGGLSMRFMFVFFILFFSTWFSAFLFWFWFAHELGFVCLCFAFHDFLVAVKPRQVGVLNRLLVAS